MMELAYCRFLAIVSFLVVIFQLCSIVSSLSNKPLLRTSAIGTGTVSSHTTALMSTMVGQWAELSPDQLDFLRETSKLRLYKDEPFKTAVQDAWKSEMPEAAKLVETATVTYSTKAQATQLYGHIVRRQKNVDGNEAMQKMRSNAPGMMFFHTAAGPHDVFLFWKAYSLLQEMDCTVLICDLFSDETGWGWDDDRTKYNQAREQIFSDLENGNGRAPILEDRVRACYDVLTTMANPNKLGAMGWCFGGHPVLQLGKMQLPGVQAMATFHGVFDTRLTEGAAAVATEDQKDATKQILICHGQHDPFVELANVETIARALESHGNNVRIMELEGAKHGFTNPAQDLNPNPAFAFQEKGARESWDEAVALLKSLE